MNELATAYIWPLDQALVRQLLDAAPPVWVLNPGSGVGGERQDVYVDLVRRLQAKGTAVIGYVHVDRGRRNVNEVQDEAKQYRSWYRVDGIFYDEAPDSMEQQGQTKAVTYCRILNGRAVTFTNIRTGHGLVVFNAGTRPSLPIMAATGASVWVTFDNSAEHYEGKAQTALPLRECHLVYGVQTSQTHLRMLESGVGWSYWTYGTPPNQWGGFR